MDSVADAARTTCEPRSPSSGIPEARMFSPVDLLSLSTLRRNGVPLPLVNDEEQCRHVSRHTLPLGKAVMRSTRFVNRLLSGADLRQGSGDGERAVNATRSGPATAEAALNFNADGMTAIAKSERPERVGCANSIPRQVAARPVERAFERRTSDDGNVERLASSVLIDERHRSHFVSGRSECRVRCARRAGHGRPFALAIKPES